MRLYEIDAEIAALIDEDTGEITDPAAFAALQVERDRKIENVACSAKNDAAMIAALRTEEQALAERRHRLEVSRARKLAWVEDALGGQPLETARVTIRYRKTARCAISDESAVIEWAQRTGHDDVLRYSAPEISREALGQLLRAGAYVPGAAWVEARKMGVK